MIFMIFFFFFFKNNYNIKIKKNKLIQQQYQNEIHLYSACILLLLYIEQL